MIHEVARESFSPATARCARTSKLKGSAGMIGANKVMRLAGAPATRRRSAAH